MKTITPRFYRVYSVSATQGTCKVTVRTWRAACAIFDMRVSYKPTRYVVIVDDKDEVKNEFYRGVT